MCFNYLLQRLGIVWGRWNSSLLSFKPTWHVGRTLSVAHYSVNELSAILHACLIFTSWNIPHSTHLEDTQKFLSLKDGRKTCFFKNCHRASDKFNKQLLFLYHLYRTWWRRRLNSVRDAIGAIGRCRKPMENVCYVWRIRCKHRLVESVKRHTTAPTTYGVYLNQLFDRPASGRHLD